MGNILNLTDPSMNLNKVVFLNYILANLIIYYYYFNFNNERQFEYHI